MSNIEFHNHQALGDTVAMTCMVRDLYNAIPQMEKQLANEKTSVGMKALLGFRIQRLKDVLGYPFQIGVKTNFPLVWENNPYITEFETADVPYEIGTGHGTQTSNTSGNHICCAYRESVEQKLGVIIPQGRIKGDLHLSNEEKADREISERYWLVTTGGRPQFTSKLWPYERWQQLVESMPNVTFVQIGLSTHYHPKLQGSNVIDMIGVTEDHEWGIRRLFKLFYHADGTVGLTSAQMHIASAFEMPCVVIAGAREPSSYEMYGWHQYLHNMGCMVCVPDSDDPNEKLKSYNSPINACWRTSIGGCPNRVQVEFDGEVFDHAKCITQISVDDVRRAMYRYYEGGMLDPLVGVKDAALEQETINVQTVAPPLDAVNQNGDIITTPAILKAHRTISAHTLPVANTIPLAGEHVPTIKLVTKALGWGGGERSPAWILKSMKNLGWNAQLVVPDMGRVNSQFKLEMLQSEVEITNDVTGECDVLVMYCNDMVYNFDKPEYEVFADVKAQRKVMVLNYKVGKAPDHPLFNKWDLYGFLSSELREGFLKKQPEANTFVLAPPVDIQPFLDADPGKLNRTLHLVRVSSQPERKYPKDTGEMMNEIRNHHSNCKFSFMSAPEWVPTGPGIEILRQGEMPVIDFLHKGNLFWYPLPDGYADQGPRVVVEALAFGLPVIADNRTGPKDRITDEIGWRCNSREEYIEVFKNLDGKMLTEKGAAAKEYARVNFDPMNWIDKIMNG